MRIEQSYTLSSCVTLINMYDAQQNEQHYTPQAARSIICDGPVSTRNCYLSIVQRFPVRMQQGGALALAAAAATGIAAVLVALSASKAKRTRLRKANPKGLVEIFDLDL